LILFHLEVNYTVNREFDIQLCLLYLFTGDKRPSLPHKKITPKNASLLDLVNKIGIPYNDVGTTSKLESGQDRKIAALRVFACVYLLIYE